MSVDEANANAETAMEARSQQRARQFFDRPAPRGYLDEWSERLLEVDDQENRDLLTVVILRLHEERLALPIEVLVEVTPTQPVHVLPHRTNDVLLGLVNIRGQLRLCVSVHGLLGIEPAPHAAEAQPNGRAAVAPDSLRRLVIIEQTDAWVFPVEEVLAVARIDRSALRPVPATLGKGAAASSAVFDWGDHTVGLLDAPKMLAALRRSCS